MGYFDSLQGEQFISLNTYRKNGTPVATPVWFAQDGERLFVMTVAESGKHKRARNNPQVDVTPCDRQGATHGTKLAAKAQVHEAASETGKYANSVLTKKYGLFKRVFDFMQAVRGTRRVYIEIKAA